MAKATMKFKRGGNTTKYFKMPISSWSPGGTLFFAAKTQPDDDPTDTQAVINKSFDDSHVTTDALYATYELDFVPSDTSHISFADGSDSATYDGEFLWVSATGKRVPAPADNKFIKVIVSADIKVGP